MIEYNDGGEMRLRGTLTTQIDLGGTLGKPMDESDIATYEDIKHIFESSKGEN